MDKLPVANHDPEAWAEQIAASLRAERESVHEFLASQEQRLEQAENALQELLERFEHEAELAANARTAKLSRIPMRTTNAVTRWRSTICES